MIKIPFNKPAYIPESETYVIQAIESGHLSGDGEFTRRSSGLLEAVTGAQKALGRRRQARMHGPQQTVAGIHQHDALALTDLTAPAGDLNAGLGRLQDVGRRLRHAGGVLDRSRRFPRA